MLSINNELKAGEELIKKDAIIGECKMSAQNPILSIVIPMFNSQDTIKACLDSVNLGSLIEVIVVDDGSTDDSKGVFLENYGENNDYIYIFQKNEGPGSARNRGIREARGKYLMFLDSDDFVDSPKLKLVTETDLMDNFDILYYNFFQVDSTYNVLKRFDLIEFANFSKDDLILSTLSWKLPWGQFKIIKRSLIVDSSISFMTNTNESEELMFTINCLKNATSIKFLKHYLYFYVKRMESLSNTHNIEEFYAKRLKMISYLKRNVDEKYKIGVLNYEYASHIQFIKMFSENHSIIESINYYETSFKPRIDILKKEIDVRYLETRYVVIYKILNIKMEYLLIALFKIRKILFDKYLNER